MNHRRKIHRWLDAICVRHIFCTLAAAAVLGAAVATHAADTAAPAEAVAPKVADSAPAAEAGDEDQPIELEFIEGDVAGMSSILSADGKTAIGTIEYRQHRRGDVLEISRIARFSDGSSDEDQVQAHVGKTLRSIGGRTIIRNTAGVAIVDLKIDIASGRISGFSGLGKKRNNYQEDAKLTPATYWGPLLAIVLKNFDKNAVDGHLEFHTVVATPKPRVFNMEFIRKEPSFTKRIGDKISVVRFSLSPAINPLLDPLIRMVTPKTDFYMQAGQPPSMARFAGPRNYAGQMIRIE
jgi:hypothetical protein